METLAQKAHEQRMRFDPTYRAEQAQRERIRKLAMEQYRFAVGAMSRMTDDELRARFESKKPPADQ